MNIRTEIGCDALVIGSGLAGLNFALQFSQSCPDLQVIVTTKSSKLMESTSNYAQGGIAAVSSLEDSFESHVEDTIKAGAGLCHHDAVKFCVEEGPKRIKDLVELGVQFTSNESSKDEFDLTQEGGHSNRRILHVADHTGRSIMEALVAQVKDRPNITLLTNMIAVDLITDARLAKERQTDTSTCLGAYFLDEEKNEIFAIQSKVTLLATGGASKVYKYTSNPDINSGDGIAMAHRVDARIANMEFTQFHPTCLFHPKAKSSLLSEALRGEGAILRNNAGEEFMAKYHPKKELAPRDIVSLSIDKEMKIRGDRCVYLDISHKGEEYVRTHFPHNYETCKKFGFDLANEPIPVVPAAHYTCGGVVTDMHGKTSIAGLYAAGEVAHTGTHGANRLASNSLLEAAVFSHAAMKDAVEYCNSYADRKNSLPKIPIWDSGFARDDEEEVIISHCWDEIRTFMWNYVGIVRTNRRLEYAARRINLLKVEIRQNYWDRKLSRNLIELRNILTIAEMIVRCSQMRKESRGLHQNLDYLQTNDEMFLRDTII